MDLLIVKREGDVMVVAHVWHSDHEMIELFILRNARRGLSRTPVLDF